MTKPQGSKGLEQAGNHLGRQQNADQVLYLKFWAITSWQIKMLVEDVPVHLETTAHRLTWSYWCCNSRVDPKNTHLCMPATSNSRRSGGKKSTKNKNPLNYTDSPYFEGRGRMKFWSLVTETHIPWVCRCSLLRNKTLAKVITLKINLACFLCNSAALWETAVTAKTSLRKNTYKCGTISIDICYYFLKTGLSIAKIAPQRSSKIK